MKKSMIGAIAGVALLASPVLAEGYATVNFHGDSNAYVGETVEVKIVVDNIRDTYNDSGIESMGGYLSFDKEYLKCIEYSLNKDPYEFFMNENIYKIAGLDFTLANGIKEKTNVLTVKFEALKEGQTYITLANPELTDSKSYIETEINGLTLNIENKVVNETVLEEVKEVSEVKETETTTKAVVRTTENSKKAETTTTTVKTSKEVKEVKKETTKKANIIVRLVNFFKKLFK